MTHQTKDRYRFRWRRPKLTIYRPATHRWFHAARNRYTDYPTGRVVTIGAAVQAGWRVFSLTWKGSGWR